MDLALNNLQRLICHKTQPTNPVNLFVRYSFYFLFTYFILFLSGGITFLFRLAQTTCHDWLNKVDSMLDSRHPSKYLSV